MQIGGGIRFRCEITDRCPDCGLSVWERCTYAYPVLQRGPCMHAWTEEVDPRSGGLHVGGWLVSGGVVDGRDGSGRLVQRRWRGVLFVIKPITWLRPSYRHCMRVPREAAASEREREKAAKGLS
jgi:hypothetical protein